LIVCGAEPTPFELAITTHWPMPVKLTRPVLQPTEHAPAIELAVTVKFGNIESHVTRYVDPMVPFATRRGDSDGDVDRLHVRATIARRRQECACAAGDERDHGRIRSYVQTPVVCEVIVAGELVVAVYVDPPAVAASVAVPRSNPPLGCSR
jgi:hypothetical protein